MRSMVIPLRKVDQVQRMVYGSIDETPDRAGEVFDYTSSKPYFEDWSKTMLEASNGRNYGNVRAMHSNIAAGYLTALTFDDAARRIDLAAYIVDDAEWTKVQAGVYTGFSPGGRYVDQWPDGGLTRYTAQPSEISIVDLPCIPSATFQYVKADGVTVNLPLGQQAAQVTPMTPLFSAEGLAARLGSLGWLYQQAGWDAVWSAPGRPLPEVVRRWLMQGAALLQPLVGGPVQPSDAAITALYADGPSNAPIWAKAGDSLIQAIHDNAVALGAVCTDCANAQSDDDGDADGDSLTDDTDPEADASLRKGSRLSAPSQRAGFAAPAPVLRAFGKGDDVMAPHEVDPMARINALSDPNAQSLELIKLAQQRPLLLRF